MGEDYIGSQSTGNNRTYNCIYVQTYGKAKLQRIPPIIVDDVTNANTIFGPDLEGV